MVTVRTVTRNDTTPRVPTKTRRERTLELRFQGKSWKQIAEAIGVSYIRARHIGSDPAFQEDLRALQDDSREAAKAVISRELVNAAEEVVELMRSGGRFDDVRLDAAKDILDRGGVTADNNSAQPIDLSVDVNLTTVLAAERAYLAALSAQPADLGTALHAGEPSGTRDHPLRALPVPGRLPDGSEQEPDYLEITPGGHESDGGA